MDSEALPRPRSRQASNNSTAPSTATSSEVWSMHRRAPPWGSGTGSGSGSRTSSRTSIWSDEGKTIAPRHGENWDVEGAVAEAEEGGERPLIELESNPGDTGSGGGADSVDMGAGTADPVENEGEEMTPAEKLKALLREMNTEVKETRGASPVKRTRQLPSAGVGRRAQERHLLDDISSTAPSEGPSPTAPAPAIGDSTTWRSAWRDRRIGSGGSGSRSVGGDEHSSAGPSSPRPSPIVPGAYDPEEEEEDDSPPTPPLRITNPYLYNRKPSRRSPTPPVAPYSPPKGESRVPTRVEVLHASASRSPPSPSSPPPPPERSALESFIASHPGPAPSSYRQSTPLRSSISSRGGSRKGKERAFISSPPDSTPPSQTPRARPGYHAAKTPRRWDIEDAPMDSTDFAASIQGLEVPGEVELDIDEGMSSRLEAMEALESESEAEAEVEGHHHGTPILQSPHRPTPQGGGRENTLYPPSNSHRRGPSEESLPALPQPDATDSEDERRDTLSSRRASLFRGSSKSPRVSLSPPQTKTPSAPRPASQSPFKLSPAQTPIASLRQTSPSAFSRGAVRGSPARLAVSPDHLEYPQEAPSADEEVQEGKDDSWKDAASSFARPASSASTSTSSPRAPPRLAPDSRQITPQRGSGTGSGNTTLGGQPTPHPPGFLSSTPVKQNVRFSPLRKHDGDWSVSQASISSNADTSAGVHRLRVSPIRHRPPVASPSQSGDRRHATAHGHREQAPKEGEEEVGNTSFTSRLSDFGRSLVRPSPSATIVPPPSKTLSTAAPSLLAAAQKSQHAKTQLETSQAAFLNALASWGGAPETAVRVARGGIRWTTYAYWIALEILLCWAVFRVTLDYAANAYPHDPWSLYSRSGGVGWGAWGAGAGPKGTVAIPPNSGLRNWVVPHRGSANFFDILEGLELWRRWEDLGWGRSEARGEGVGMVGGVPT